MLTAPAAAQAWRRRAQAAGSTLLLPAGRGRASCLESCDGGCIHLVFFAAFATAGRGSRAYEANIASSAASLNGRCGSQRRWLQLPCVGAGKHVQNVSRPSPPCPLNPCPPLLLCRTAPEAANLSLNCDFQQVDLRPEHGFGAVERRRGAVCEPRAAPRRLP